MSAPCAEHRRERSEVRGNTEHTACYAQEIRYHQSVLHGAHGRQAAQGNDTGRLGGPAAAESGWNAPARSCGSAELFGVRFAMGLLAAAAAGSAGRRRGFYIS